MTQQSSLLKPSLITWLILITLTLCSPVYAFNFQPGDDAWIDMPAVNIDDDAYAQGKVVAIVDKQHIKVRVQSITKTKAFSSGISCAHNTNDDMVWKTPDVLRTEQESTFPITQLYPLTYGKNRFYERQNWLLTFLKWADHHPVIERDRFTESKKIMLELNMPDLAAVTDLMLREYDAYQNEHFVYYPIEQRTHRLVDVLTFITQTFTDHPQLHALWKSKPRDFSQLNQDSYAYFTVLAIDKILADIRKSRQLFLDTHHQPNADIQRIDQLLAQL